MTLNPLHVELAGSKEPAFTLTSQLSVLTIPVKSLILVQEKLGSNKIAAIKDLLINLLRKY